MSDSLYDNILSEVSQVTGRSIRVLGVGGLQEPLLDSKLIDRIDLARAYFPRAAITITTNATLLTPEIGKQLINRLDGMCISLNSFDKAVYQCLNNKDAYEATVQNINTFLSMKGARKPFTEIQLLNVESNKPYVQGFLDYYGKWSGSNIKLKLHDLHSWAGNLADYPQKPMSSRRPCVQLWDYLWFSAEGDVYPCCLGEVAHDLCFGNIRDGVSSLLASRKLAEMRLRHLYNEYTGSCQCCQVWREKVAPMIQVGKRWL
jgi:radical SAM protein with 4Fe4S-binding SPASM domain